MSSIHPGAVPVIVNIRLYSLTSVIRCMRSKSFFTLSLIFGHGPHLFKISINCLIKLCRTASSSLAFILEYVCFIWSSSPSCGGDPNFHIILLPFRKITSLMMYSTGLMMYLITQDGSIGSESLSCGSSGKLSMFVQVMKMSFVFKSCIPYRIR